MVDPDHNLLLAGLAAIVTTVFTIYTYCWRTSFLERAVLTKGEVIDTKVTSSANYSPRHGFREVVHYTTQIKFQTRTGSEHMFWHTSSNRGLGARWFGTAPWVTGQTVELYYDPKDISCVMLKHQLWWIPVLSALLSAFLITIATIAFIRTYDSDFMITIPYLKSFFEPYFL